MRKLIYILLLLPLAGWGQVDSYSETNQSSYTTLRNASTIYVGNSFTCSSKVTLDSCIFYLQKVGSPTGNVKAYIYEHTGTYGTDGTPTGSALATSDNVDISGISTSYELITFTFSGANQITLSASTYYVVQCYYNGGDASNNLLVGTDNSSSSHDGNRSNSTDGSSWAVNANVDVCFYVYGTSASTPQNIFLA